MRLRVAHFVGFLFASITLTALVLVLGLYLETLDVRPDTAEVLLLPLLWIGSIGGFICASIIATKTAWLFYGINHRAGSVNCIGERTPMK